MEMSKAKRIELKAPDLGDSDKIELIKWNFTPGDIIDEGDEILELVTDKAAFPVESPIKGVLQEILVQSGTVVTGQVLGILIVAKDID